MAIKHLNLPNGLRVVLYHAPRLKRCAAVLRVAAGSHDVSPMWPGLAHFLEHLLFLGTERFAVADNLMTFVRRHGGQVNASTAERTTDFFFELPPATFAQGLERLCDMLAHPRWSLEDQLREREVLHAEFIAWSQDPETLRHADLMQSVSPRHPLRAFHAGNRYSLPVQGQAFQQALRDFHERFYQAGQMTLSLTGPQSLDELEALASHFGGYFAAGEKRQPLPPPPLLDELPGAAPDIDPHRLNLVFACENLPESSAEAARFLCTWISDPRAGGVLFELRERHLIEALKAESLYQFDGQLLLNVEFTLGHEGIHQRQRITALFFDWLNYFSSHWIELREEYALLQQRHLAISGALELARYFCRGSDGQLPMKQLLEQIRPAVVDNLPSEPITWALPEPNPFLHGAVEDSDDSALFLRWRLDAAHPKLWQMLNDSLQSLALAARQAGVIVNFSAQGNFWQLTLSGLPDPIPAVLQHVLKLLAAPDSKTLARFAQSAIAPVQMPIRQLLNQFPDDFLDARVAVDNSTDLPAVWANARWTTFILGLPAGTLDNKRLLIPGNPEEFPLRAPERNRAKRQISHASDSSENAVLLFCPTPGQRLSDEAGWRLLASLGQAPFYQRLRVELQLGYAVFSSFRQIAGQSGWLFGVQSPTASVEEIINHIQAFITELPTLIENSDLPNVQQALAAQFDPLAMDAVQTNEWLWQAYLAGRDGYYSQRLCDAILHFKKPQLFSSVDDLQRATGGRLIVTNRPLSQ